MTELVEFLLARGPDDGLPNWVGEVGGLVGTGLSLVAIIISLLVRHDNRRHTEEAPARQRLQARLDDVTREMADLVPAVQAAGRLLQEEDDFAAAVTGLRESAMTIRRCVGAMRELTIPPLSPQLESLGAATVDRGPDGEPSVADGLVSAAAWMERVVRLRRDVEDGSGGTAKVRDLMQASRGLETTSRHLGVKVGRAEEAALVVSDSVRQLESRGMGKLP
ncbi:MAG: hypothetical protein GEV10_16085 [Streptosporangiales bacterium]|nr:hypothetical protein [Streptosporangiales bacterium]